MCNRLKQIIAGCFILIFFACSSTRLSQAKNNFTGHIYEHKFNGMPMLDKPATKGAPLKTMLYIYEPTTIHQIEDGMHLGNIITKINTTVVDSVQSDEMGAFALHLKAGKYSVFVKYENGYYVPFYAGMESVSVIEILPNQVTNLDIQVKGSSSFQ